VILVDSSVWIDHFRHRGAELSALLASRVVMIHPFVIGELACGHLPERDAVFEALARLPQAPVVPHGEVLAFVERHRLMARGIGWVDVHLLASATVAGRVSLWSRDRRLMAAAAERGVAYPGRLMMR
jgi:predicted nucleic acid-binding protein